MADSSLARTGDLPASNRKPISPRTRFEVFKRDEFTCRYCGRKSPDVVLEVDHIVAVSAGGSDDPINLATSCWECNRGKSDVPLSQTMTGEDPHDRAVAMLERARQLSEYNQVLAYDIAAREEDAWVLAHHWLNEQGKLTPAQANGTDNYSFPRRDLTWLRDAMAWIPREKIREFMDTAISRNMTRSLAYVIACANNWRCEHAANQDMGRRR